MVVIVGIDLKVIDKGLNPLGGAPGFAKQAIHVGSKHRTGVVEAKERVIAEVFKLPLADHTAPSSEMSLVGDEGEVPSHISWVVRVFI